MARTFVRISLATKFRVLLATAVLAVLAVALGVPWYFAERLVDESAERSAAQVTRLSLSEWVWRHRTSPRVDSAVAEYFTSAGGGRRGPTFVPLVEAEQEDRLDEYARRAAATLAGSPISFCSRRTRLSPMASPLAGRGWPD